MLISSVGQRAARPAEDVSQRIVEPDLRRLDRTRLDRPRRYGFAVAEAHQNHTPTVRPTLRLLRDLGIAIPELASGLDELSHPMFDKAHALAAAYPQNLVRIQGITDALVYRFTHGRRRVVTWHDTEKQVIWICACELRSDDTYDDVLTLHTSGELLPDDADHERFGQESALRVVRELVESVPEWIRAARSNRGIEQRIVMHDGAQVRMIVQDDGDLQELWIAMPTCEAAVPGLHPNVRAALVAIAVQSFAEPSAWEVRYDWPTGPLLRWEVARLGMGTPKRG